jgi:hypothetical protein
VGLGEGLQPTLAPGDSRSGGAPQDREVRPLLTRADQFHCCCQEDSQTCN